CARDWGEYPLEYW
nr:immunoglobulin heavy chain junction region [Macaca mulatta]